MDMNYVLDPEQVEYWSLDKHTGVSAKLLADGKNMTVLYTSWAAGALAPEHTHPHEQMGLCLQGEAIFTIDSVDYVVKAGSFYQIPGGVPHAERNDGSQPAILIDFFSPIREDLLRKKFEANTLR
jgi:quercetin dioxygenase-like cupin family protein